MQEKEVYEYLTAHGVKASVQRVAVMQYLLQQMGHPTVDEIYQALVDHIPTLSKTTVYNTLRLLMEHGVVRMLTIDGKNANFDGVTEPHAHFLCHTLSRLPTCWLRHLLPLKALLSKLPTCIIGGYVPTVWHNKTLESKLLIKI